MSEEETQTETEEPTQAGGETGQDADTKDGEKQETVITQAEVDRRISAGIKAGIQSYEDKQNQKIEQDKKIQQITDGKFEELYKETQAQNDALKASIEAKEFKSEAQDALIKLDMGHLSDAIIPNAKTIDEVLSAAEVLKNTITEEASKQANALLDTGKPRVPTKEHTTTAPKLGNMNAEEFAAYKTANGLR